MEENITKCIEAKELREWEKWDLGQMICVNFEMSKNDDKNSDRRLQAKIFQKWGEMNEI